MPARVLITGATGFAGSFLVERYIAHGWEVHGTFRTPPADGSWIPATAALHRIDLLDARAVKDLVSVIHPDLVFHLAAQSSVAASWRDPMSTLRVNAALQCNLLEALSDVCPEARTLVVGSSDEYGLVARELNPIAETQELLPANPYGLSKVIQDLMGHQYFAARGLPVVRVRPFLQLGPRRPDRFAAGSFARQIAEIERGLLPPVVKAGGIDLERDFTDVRDIVRAYSLAAEHGEPGEVYNVASGETHTMRDLIREMLAAAGVDAEIRTDEHLLRRGEPPLLLGDAGRLRRRTGWTPMISFEQSAADTVAYWREYPGLLVSSQGELS